MRPRPAQWFRRLLGLGFVAFPVCPAVAGAWLQAQGHGEIIVSQYAYLADEFLNNQGNRRQQSRYYKGEVIPYIEYGWRDWLTLGGSVSLQGVSQNAESNYGIGDSEFFARAKLWEKENFVLSISPLLKLPSPDRANARPKIGSDTPDAGLGLSAGYNFSAFGERHFVDGSVTYRHRFGDPEDQVHLAATLGWSLSPRWVVMPQLFITRRAADAPGATFTQSSADDYNLVKSQLSVVYKVSDRTSIQLGGVFDIDGKNTGVGQGIVFSVWRNF